MDKAARLARLFAHQGDAGESRSDLATLASVLDTLAEADAEWLRLHFCQFAHELMEMYAAHGRCRAGACRSTQRRSYAATRFDETRHQLREFTDSLWLDLSTVSVQQEFLQLQQDMIEDCIAHARMLERVAAVRRRIELDRAT